MAMKRLFTILIACAAALALAQDQTDSADAAEAAAQQQVQQAAVRIAHLAPNAPAVRITVDGQTAFDSVSADSITDYMLLPAGEIQIEVTAADAAQEGQQEGQQEGEQQAEQEQEAQVERGQVPEAVAQAVQNALQAVQEDGDAQTAVDTAVNEIDAAVQSASAEALPVLEPVQAAITEAQEALANDEPEVAQTALEQAQTLIDGAAQESEQQEGEQEGEQQEQQGPQALFSQSVTLEPGSYTTVLATAESSEASSTGDAQDEQSQPVAFQILQDDLSLPPAGAALVRVVHAAPGAPAVNLVVAQSGQQEGQQQEGQQQEGQQQSDTEQQDAEQETDAEQSDAEQTDAGEQTDTEQTDTEQSDTGQTDTEQSDTEQTDAAEQPGTLAITIEPQAAQGATVNVTGPDGFEQNLTGGQTLSGLQAGSYVVSATLRAYQPAATQVEVQGGQDAQATLTLQRLPSAGPAPIDGRTAVSDVAPGSASGYQPVAAATYTAQLRAVDADVTAIELRQLQLQPGAAYTLFAYGSLADDSFNVAVTVDALVPQGGSEPQDAGASQEGEGSGAAAQEGEGQQQEGEEDADGPVEDAAEDAASDAAAAADAAADEIGAEFSENFGPLVQQTRDALDADELEGARQTLEQMQQQVEQALENAGGEAQQELQEIGTSIENAVAALDGDDVEGARQALDDVEGRLQ